VLPTESLDAFKTLRAPTPTKIDAFINNATLLHLAFNLDITCLPSDCIATTFNTALLEHFNSHGFAFSSILLDSSSSSCHAPLSFAANDLQWTILTTGKQQRVVHLGVLLKPISRISPNSMTHAELKKEISRFPALSAAHGDCKLVFLSKVSPFAEGFSEADFFY
jgi:hypothetical protein